MRSPKIFRATDNSTVKFYRNEDHSLWGSTSEDWAYRNEVMGTTNEMIEVKAIDFGKCIEKYGVPFYLKADIVGSESVCLRAMQKFENQPDYLSIRSEKVIFRRLENEFDLLEKLGYDRFKAVQQDFEHLEIPIETEEKQLYSFEEGASGPFRRRNRRRMENARTGFERIPAGFRLLLAVRRLFLSDSNRTRQKFYRPARTNRPPSSARLV